MKGIISFVFVIATVVCLCRAKPEEKYTSKYDNVDLDQILQSDRLLKNYLNCLLDKGKCTPDGAELKKNLPDALENGCSKCNEKQKNGAKKVINFLIENKREWFDEVAAKYDPEGKYLKKYEDDAKKANIKL